MIVRDFVGWGLLLVVTTGCAALYTDRANPSTSPVTIAGVDFPEAATARWQVQARAILNVPPEEVFACVSNPLSAPMPSDMTAWADHSHSSSGPDEIGVGSVFPCEYKGFKVVKTVTVYQPPRLVAFRIVQEAKGKRKEALSVFELKRLAGGQTELTDYAFVLSESNALAEWIGERGTQWILDRDMDRFVQRFGGRQVVLND
jgi:uncharacterized protein YndB with AHSA1/START domain